MYITNTKSSISSLLSCLINEYRDAIAAENFIWNRLEAYFKSSYISNIQLPTGQLVYGLCDFPGLLPSLVTYGISDNKYVRDFFAFEKNKEPKVPASYIHEEKAWTKYYSDAILYHTQRTKLLEEFVDVVTANVPKRYFINIEIPA